MATITVEFQASDDIYGEISEFGDFDGDEDDLEEIKDLMSKYLEEDMSGGYRISIEFKTGKKPKVLLKPKIKSEWSLSE